MCMDYSTTEYNHVKRSATHPSASNLSFHERRKIVFYYITHAKEALKSIIIKYRAVA